MLDQMDRSDRLRLLRFVTSFAWADGVVQNEEREFLRGLMQRLPLGKDEVALAESWLDTPPHPAEVDPQKIPPQHRNLFLSVVRGMVNADGHVDEEERERLELLEQMLLGR
jgi:uncharacterized membrane protein YebE (DUF533 family)